MNREEFLKGQPGNSGRVTQKVVRTRADFPDGILKCETQAQFIRNGVIHVVESTEVLELACGHYDRAGLRCCQQAEEGLAFHYVCAKCASKCDDCSANICAHHAVLIEEARYCGECAGKLAWDGIFSSLTGAIGRFLS